MKLTLWNFQELIGNSIIDVGISISSRNVHKAFPLEWQSDITYFEEKRFVEFYRMVSYSGCSVIWLTELWGLQIFRFEVECDLHIAGRAQLILTATIVS